MIEQLVELHGSNHKKIALIGTGEFTVTLKGRGVGGRNQEMLLAFLIHLVEQKEGFIMVPVTYHYDHHASSILKERPTLTHRHRHTDMTTITLPLHLPTHMLTTLVTFLQNYDFTIVSAAYDGIEGNSPATGAIVDTHTISSISEKNGKTMTNPEILEHLKHFLDRNDSFSFFQSISGAIITGYTGTNVNDMVMILLVKRDYVGSQEE
eukprot:TRINITY_DN1829_c0_g1_i1.p1 TRINITY_DN1829_c0_g1~~TRINITY_DN1829_c0_g1_i1.p1  ORF type:complete len:229 (+),score=50.15 TRINITY_DN1829_c0_g1_i1:64-687(+)